MSSITPRFHRLTVADVRRETPDAVSVSFRVPDALREDYRFEPGQYLTLRTAIDGEDLRRCYSISSGPTDGELRIGVKRIEGGAVSTWINAELHEGYAIDVMTPAGRYGPSRYDAEVARVHVGFAAGSGITPILSIIRGVLEREPLSKFFLFYGNRSSQDVLFRDALEDMKDRFLSRLAVFHVLSREEQDLPILNGRLDRTKAELMLRALVPAASVDNVFICGPTTMIDELEATCFDLGIVRERIHVERFVSALVGMTRPQACDETGATGLVAAIIIDGKRKEVSVAESETLLDAALRAGMDLPYACKGGMCSTCRAKILYGAAEMEVNYSLEPWEIAAGFVLACQAHQTTDSIVIDFDEA